MFWSMTTMLIAFFGIALLKILKRANQKIAVKLLGLMFVSNLCILTCMLLFRFVHSYIIIHPDDTTLPWYMWISALFAFLTFVTSEAFFNIATWLLAFNYWMCAAKLEQAWNRQSEHVEPKLEKFHRFVFWAMLTASFISSTAWGYFRFMRNYSTLNHGDTTYAKQEYIA